ncbi:MAG: FtsX-like permease family protein [Chitinophagaceae bacterium]|nr:MAG: FtsX-like permease family protein [Chitinophagaceae bacterium]
MRFIDVFLISYRSVRSNKLRTGLTVAIIALGIMALILVNTSIKAINQKFTDSFSTMGANGFTIRYKERNIHFGNDGNNELKKEKSGKKKEKKSNMGKRITIDEADLFKENFKFPSSSSISVFANRESLISFETKKTNPNVIVIGADENYLLLNGFELAGGRNINLIDIQSARYVCLLGNDVASKLFGGKPDKAVNEIVRVQNIPYRVIGILASRGSSFGMSLDNRVITSYKNVDRQFNSGSSYVVAVKTDDILQMDQASGEAEGLFRAVRKLTTTEENNFVLDRNDSMVEKAMNSIGFITISATVIGLITLIGAAIGLMNIMLVAVSERTKEVGLIKAIGGKSKIVRYQFLLESTIISVMGALFGIVFGILFGNGVSLLIDTGFVVPWNWVILGIVICTVVGLLAGLYPALKAGRLNPIEALRYE